MENFKLIIVEDVPLELKGTEGIVRHEIPEAEVIGTASNEVEYWRVIKQQQPDLVLLDLGLGGSTTVGVEICRHTKESYPQVKVLIFTGEILNEKLWVDVLDAGADGIILKSGELLTRADVRAVMEGKQLVFNEPILKKIVERFKHAVSSQLARQEALVNYEIDEYDERFLRHLALGYTKEQITNLRGMPFGVKSLEKRQNELVHKLFPGGESVNATRLVVRAWNSVSLILIIWNPIQNEAFPSIYCPVSVTGRDCPDSRVVAHERRTAYQWCALYAVGRGTALVHGTFR